MYRSVWGDMALGVAWRVKRGEMEDRVVVTWLWHGRWQGNGYECVRIKHAGSGRNNHSPGHLGPPAQPPGPAPDGPHVPHLAG